MTVVFVDACIFLEFPPIGQIDWLKLTGDSEARLVLTIPVLNALDHYKTDPRRAQRAVRALENIREIWNRNNGVREEVTLETLADEILKADFPTGYSPDSNDDHILLLLKKYQNDNPGLKVVMSSEDGGMEAKCRARKVQFLRPDPTTRLPSVPDEQTKELNRLRLENEKMKFRQPSIVVGFENDGKVCGKYSFQIGIPIESKPKLDIPDGRIGRTYQDMMVSDEDKEAYRQECIDYNESLDLLKAICASSFEVEFSIANTGTAPATDIEILISFPVGVYVLDADRIKPPTVPERPMYGSIGAINVPGIAPAFDFHETANIEDREDEPTILRLGFQELQQHTLKPVKLMVVGFLEPDGVKSFQADCRIISNELPEPVQFTLNFVLSDQKPA